VTITAVADAVGAPPSVDVTVTSGVGTVMSSVALWRNDSSGRSLVRSQPSAGFDERTVTDYECPYGESVTYDWAATYVSSFTSVWDETWASTASWTLGSGSAWAVSGGKVHNNSAASDLYRSVASGKYRVVVDGWTVDGSGTGYLLFQTAGFAGTAVGLRLNGGVLSLTVNDTGYTVSSIDSTLPFTVDVNATSVTLSGTGDPLTLPGDVDFVYVALVANDVGASDYEIDNIEVFSYGVESEIAETSTPVTLDPDDAWLIHPGTPGLSIPIIETGNTATRMVEIGEIENATNTTVHRILGSATPIPTTTGPRGDDTTALIIETVTTNEAAAVRALLASDVPILIQIPPAWDLDFNCGFYQVGDVRTARSDPIINAYRTFTLPLTKVQSPVVDVENTGWSYAAVAAEFDTYSSLLVTFATYADLAADTRS
jgi:hypothetical protein